MRYWFARTRGGMLVGLVVMAAIGFEIRTVLGHIFGIDTPATEYVIVMIALLSIVGVIMDVTRSTEAEPPS